MGFFFFVLCLFEYSVDLVVLTFLPLCIDKVVSISLLFSFSLYLFVLLLLQVAIFSGWVRLFECLRNEHIMCIIRIIKHHTHLICITGVLVPSSHFDSCVQAG